MVALKWIFLSNLLDRQCPDVTEPLCPPHFGKWLVSRDRAPMGKGFRELPAPAKDLGTGEMVMGNT